MNFEADDAKTWLRKMNEKIKVHTNYLTILDEKIGDGDHGFNMAKGFEAVVQRMDNNYNNEYDTVSNVFRNSAITIMTHVGGAAGILYATAFLRMATVFKENNTIDVTIFTKALKRAIDGMMQRGNVKYGEKTLVDVWITISNLFEQSEQFPSAQVIEETARVAMEKTKVSIAKKGKAALYEEQSIGHIDPGAASTYYLFQSLAETIKENKSWRIS